MQACESAPTLLLASLSFALMACQGSAASTEVVAEPEVVKFVVPARQPPPVLDPEYAVPCGDLQPGARLLDLMVEQINPGLTQLSFALHHGQGDDPTERLDRAARAAAKLLACITMVGDFQDEIPSDRIEQHHIYLNDLQSHAFAVHLASLELDEAGGRHWFMHLKQDCAACHARVDTKARD